MAVAAYEKPEVRDYGTLLEVTSHIDVNFLGAVSNLVLAALSGPLPPKGTISQTTAGASGVHGGGPGGGAGGAHGGGGILGLGSGGGKLPFTGLSTVLVAAVGAALASAGASLRVLLRRRPLRRGD